MQQANRHISDSNFVIVGRVLVLVGFLLIWFAITALDLVERTVLTGPAETWRAFVELASGGALLTNLWSTLEATLIALVVAGVPGAILGLMLALLPRTEAIMSPYIDAFNSAPRIALAPVLIVLFGLGQLPKIVLAGTLVVFVTLMNARAGVHAAEDDYLRLLRAMGASKYQVFTKALLPVAAPALAIGFRLGLIYSLLGVVAMELISAERGIGVLIAQYSATFQMDKVYALLLILILIAALLNTGTQYIERRLLKWQPPKTH
jgi:NitT/TauT family transport system permease protein